MCYQTRLKIKLFVALLLVMTLPACITVQAIEPVINPPTFYQADVTVPVEFVPPPMVGMRCTERGAKFLGLPGLNAGACADPQLVTMPDPCMTFTGGAFASALCQQYEAALRVEEDMQEPGKIATADLSARALISNATWAPETGEAEARMFDAAYTQNSATSPARHRPESRGVSIEFAAPEYIEYRCAERGAKFVDDRGSGVIACADRNLVTISNPCALDDGGWYARTLCHEMAHANGWPADHSRRPPPPRASESAQAVRWREAQKEAAEMPEEQQAAEAEIVEAQSSGDAVEDTDPAIWQSMHANAGKVQSPVTDDGRSVVPPEETLHLAGAAALPKPHDEDPEPLVRTMLAYGPGPRMTLFSKSMMLAP